MRKSQEGRGPTDISQKSYSKASLQVNNKWGQTQNRDFATRITKQVQLMGGKNMVKLQILDNIIE